MSQCTAVASGPSGAVETTFNPQAPAANTLITVTGSDRALLDAIACPSGTQCTAVGNEGDVVTFDPLADAPAGGYKPATFAGHELVSVACPTTGQCTALDTRGARLTFDPHPTPGNPAVATVDATTRGVMNVLCPSATQCSVADGDGSVVTFNPQWGPRRRRPSAAASSSR